MSDMDIQELNVLVDQLIAERDEARAQLVKTERALTECLLSMEMRESGDFHLSQPNARALWDRAKKMGFACVQPRGR
jgi:hypothetical protein